MTNITKENSDNKDFLKFIKWVSFVPFMGLFSSVLSAFFLLFTPKQWSLWMIVYILIPFTISVVAYLLIVLFINKKHGIIIPFINKKVRIVMIFILITFLFLIFMLYHRNYNEINEIAK